MSVLALLLACAAVALAWQVRLLIHEQRGRPADTAHHAGGAPFTPREYTRRQGTRSREPGGPAGHEDKARRRAPRGEARAALAPDPWAPFEVRPGMAPAELARQYHRLALLHHPDHGGDARMMARINGLYVQLRRRL